MEPSFIREYSALYRELHTPDNKHPHIKEIDQRIVTITKAIHDTPVFSQETTISPDEIKTLSTSEVEDINRLARDTLLNESGFLKRLVIRFLRFITAGNYVGVHQIPVKEFTASVTKYIEKSKELTKFLDPIPEVKEGYLEGCTDLVQGKCYYVWKNTDADNALVVSIVNENNWKHYACSFSDFSNDKVTLTNTINENDKFTVTVSHLNKFEEEIENRLDVPPYGKVRFEELMRQYVVSVPVGKYTTILALLRSCEVLKKPISALTQGPEGYVVSTIDAAGKITQEKLSVNSYGKVTLTNAANDQVRTFQTIEQFKNSYFTRDNIPVLDAVRLVNLGEKGRMQVNAQKELILKGAEILKIGVSSKAVDALKREIEGQSLYLEPSRCGGFLYETSDPQLVKVVYATNEGIVEKDIHIRDQGVIFGEKGFPLNTPLNIILGWDEKPFVPMENARRSLTKMMQEGVSFSDVSERLRRNPAFCLREDLNDAVQDIAEHSDKSKLAGLYMIVPTGQKAKSWLDAILGDYDPTFKEFSLYINNGKGFESLQIQIDPSTASNPYVYMAKHYPSPEAILQEQKAHLRSLLKPYKQFFPKVVEKQTPSSQPKPLPAPQIRQEEPKQIEPAKTHEPKVPEGPGIIAQFISAVTPLFPKPSEGVVQAPRPVESQQPAKPLPAQKAPIDKTLKGVRDRLINSKTGAFYSLNAKAAIEPRKALINQLGEWRSAGITLSKAQVDEAFSILLLNDSYEELYPSLESITILSLQVLPAAGRKAFRDEIVSWLWNQK